MLFPIEDRGRPRWPNHGPKIAIWVDFENVFYAIEICLYTLHLNAWAHAHHHHPYSYIGAPISSHTNSQILHFKKYQLNQIPSILLAFVFSTRLAMPFVLLKLQQVSYFKLPPAYIRALLIVSFSMVLLIPKSKHYIWIVCRSCKRSTSWSNV